MAQLPLKEAVERFQSNEERLDQFANDPEGTGAYETSEGEQVKTLPELAALAQALELRLRSVLPGEGAAILGSGTVALNSVARLLSIPAIGRRADLQYQTASYYQNFAFAKLYGGATYRWRPDIARSAHNAGSIISPTVPWNGESATWVDFKNGVGETEPDESGCWFLVSVWNDVGAWGCSPEITDNAPQLNNMQNFSRRSIFEKGAYRFNSSIIPRNNAFFGGFSQRDTVLEGTGAFMLVDTLVSTGASNRYYITYEHITLKGPGREIVNSEGITIRHQTTMFDARITGFWRGVNFQNSTFSIRKCSIDGNHFGMVVDDYEYENVVGSGFTDSAIIEELWVVFNAVGFMNTGGRNFNINMSSVFFQHNILSMALNGWTSIKARDCWFEQMGRVAPDLNSTQLTYMDMNITSSLPSGVAAGNATTVTVTDARLIPTCGLAMIGGSRAGAAITGGELVYFKQLIKRTTHNAAFPITIYRGAESSPITAHEIGATFIPIPTYVHQDEQSTIKLDYPRWTDSGLSHRWKTHNKFNSPEPRLVEDDVNFLSRFAPNGYSIGKSVTNRLTWDSFGRFKFLDATDVASEFANGGPRRSLASSRVFDCISDRMISGNLTSADLMTLTFPPMSAGATASGQTHAVELTVNVFTVQTDASNSSSQATYNLKFMVTGNKALGDTNIVASSLTTSLIATRGTWPTGPTFALVQSGDTVSLRCTLQYAGVKTTSTTCNGRVSSNYRAFTVSDVTAV